MGEENKKVREWKYHFLYKVVNVKNGKYYIGIHSTNNLDDGYLGSGTRLKKSIQYHGRNSHEREILEFFETREDVLIKEFDVVNEVLLKDPKCMNLSIGGKGFKELSEKFFESSAARGKKGAEVFAKKMKEDLEFRNKFIQSIREGGRKGNESFKKRITEDEEFRKSFVEKAKESNKNNLRGFCKNPKDYGKTFEGHSHTEEVKRSIGEKNSLHQQGEKNSQFGTIWVNKEGKNKKIKKEEKEKYLEDGWTMGINHEIFSNPKGKKLLDKELVLQIRDLLERGISGRKISSDLGIGRTTIEKIRRGESYSYYKK
jgi:hypothetical protein